MQVNPRQQDSKLLHFSHWPRHGCGLVVLVPIVGLGDGVGRNVFVVLRLRAVVLTGGWGDTVGVSFLGGFVSQVDRAFVVDLGKQCWTLQSPPATHLQIPPRHLSPGQQGFCGGGLQDSHCLGP